MKKKSKLTLRKETIAELSNEDMNNVNGGLFKSSLWCSSNKVTNCAGVTLCGSKCDGATGHKLEAQN